MQSVPTTLRLNNPTKVNEARDIGTGATEGKAAPDPARRERPWEISRTMPVSVMPTSREGGGVRQRQRDNK